MGVCGDEWRCDPEGQAAGARTCPGAGAMATVLMPHGLSKALACLLV